MFSRLMIRGAQMSRVASRSAVRGYASAPQNAGSVMDRVKAAGESVGKMAERALGCA